MSFLTPEFEGALEEPVADGFLEVVARRVEEGSFPARGGARQRYRTTESGGGDAADYRSAQPAQRLRVVATDWSTRFAIGLNEVDLEVRTDRKLRYRVSYRQWTRLPIALAAAFTIVTAVAAIAIAGFAPPGPVPGGALPGIAMGLFWGGAWPWLLAAILTVAHKKAARGALERFLTEVASEARQSATDGISIALRERSNAILAVLRSRRIELDDEARERISGATDPSQLDDWLARAAVASSQAELFARQPTRIGPIAGEPAVEARERASDREHEAEAELDLESKRRRERRT